MESTSDQTETASLRYDNTSGVLNVYGAGRLTISNSFNYFTANISVGYGVNAGNLAIQNPSGFTGNVSIGSGILYVASNSQFAAGTYSLNAFSTDCTAELRLTATGEYKKAIAIGTNGGIINATATNSTTTYSGNLTGTDGHLTLKSSGTTLVLSGTNTYSGGTTISNGAKVSISANSKLGSNNLVANNTLNGGTLILTSAGTYARAWTFTGNNTITANADATLSGSLGASGNSGNLTKNGSSKLTLSVANAYTGSTTVSAGTLALSGAGAIANSSGVTLSGTGKFDVSGVNSSATIKTLNSSVNGTEVVLGSKTLIVSGTGTFDGAINGAGNFTKSGTGTLTLHSANGYTGVTTVSGTTAVLALADDGSIADSSGVVLAGTATFSIAGIYGTTTIRGLSGVSGTKVLLGENTLVVSGDCDFAGNITGAANGKLVKSDGGQLSTAGNYVLDFVEVRGSELSINGTLTGTIGAVEVSVLDAGILSGTGTITGNVTVTEGGVLSPGNSPGTLNVDGNVTLSADAQFLLQVDGTGAFDKVVVTSGAFVFLEGSELNLELNASIWDAEEEFDLQFITGAVTLPVGGIGAVNFSYESELVPDGWALEWRVGEGDSGAYLHGYQVPEPSTYALFGGIGAVALALIRRRKNKK